jgi:autotransporter-associated beta strand protein
MTVKYSSLVVLVLACCSIIAIPAGATDLSILKQNYVDQQYGLFLHYSMGTYTNEEWAHSLAMSSINTFNPTAGLVDTNQWAATAVAAGMKYGVLTTKHHDGFALWNTSQSTYDIASTSWYGTYHQDIVGSYVNSFRNAGLGVGLYYSFWDKYNGVGITPYYGNDVTLGRKSSAAATAYVKSEISQLLSNYGQIDVLWVDGWGWANTSQGCPYSDVNYADVYNYIHTNWPNTLLINNVNEGNTTHTDVIDYETQFSGQMPPVGNTVPSEGNATLRSNNGWFYTGSPPSSVDYKSASYVGAVTLMMNSRNASYLLDVPPDTTGLIPTAAVNRMAEIKTYLATTPGLRSGNLAYGKTATQSSTWSSDFPAGKATDDDRTNISHTATSDTNPWWRVDLGSLTPIGEIELFNRVIECSGRLRDITVEILAANGTTVLYTSDLLNPDNIMGGGVNDYANGPTRLCLFVNNGTPVTGRYIRVRRTAETSGSTNLDDLRALSLSDVEVYAVRPGAIKWKGATSVWDVNTTANWFNTAALITDKYHVSPTADSVTFSDLYNDVFNSTFAPTTTAITLNTTVSPSSVVFDSDTLNYSLSGTGSISGSTSLVKSGASELTISTANHYTGGTTVKKGMLKINNAASLGSGSANVNSGGTLFLNVDSGGGDNDVTYTNSIDGAGVLKIRGPNSHWATAILTGDLSGFTGTIDIVPYNGTNGGKMMFAGGAAFLPSSSATIKVESGTTLYLNAAYISEATDYVANIQLYGASNVENLGALRLESNANQKGLVTLMNNSSIGVNLYDGTISGSIGESGDSFGFTKQGNAKLILAGINTYTGDTNVDNGILELAATGQISIYSHISTAASTTFQVNGGTHAVGAISGAGNTSIMAGSTVTAISIAQNTLTIGIGSKLTIASVGSFQPCSASVSVVPEPSISAMLVLAFMGLGLYWQRNR